MWNQKGNGRLGVLVWLVIISAALFVAFRTIPVRVSVLKLHDFCDDQTRYAAASNKMTEEQLIRDVLDKAKQLDVPLTRKQVRFHKQKNEVSLSVKHSVSVNLEFYEWVWDYDKRFEHIRF